jgi:hypothetical protein
VTFYSANQSVRGLATLLAAILMGYSAASMSAEVKYQHPNLTIVAEDEPLDSVLKSLGREMRIFVTVPTGFNPVVSCDVQNQSVKQALKSLLGEMSYSLEWESGGERLAGLTIFGSDAQTTAGASPARNTQYPDGETAGPQSVDNAVGQEAAVSRSGGAIPAQVEDNAVELTAEMDAQRAEHEARMAEEREIHEAEMALRRQEEEVAQEARMQEETARHEAEMRAYIESQGLKFPE